MDCKSYELKGQYTAKVNEFLRDALDEDDLFRKAKLLGKAVYWNLMAMKSDPDIIVKRGKPVPPRIALDQTNAE